MNREDQIKEAIADAIRTASTVTLAQAKALIARVEQKAEEMGVSVVVAVADSGANPVAIECMDNSFLASYDIALQKSFTCVALKMSTMTLKPLAQPGQSLYGIQFTNQGKIVVFGGGEPLLRGGNVVGAIGVSGGTEDQDAALAAYGKRVFEEELLHA